MNSTSSKSYRLPWIAPDRGPLVLLPEDERVTWNGNELTKSNASKAKEGASKDAVKQEKQSTGKVSEGESGIPWSGTVAFFNTDKHRVSLFGHEPVPTSWAGFKDCFNCVIIRWLKAKDEKTVLRWLPEMPADGWRLDGSIVIKSRSHLLFPANKPGRDLKKLDAISIDLQPGTYEVATLDFRPDEDTYLRLHRLTYLWAG